MYGACGTWKQIAVVSDERIAWIELVPALLGWNVRREWVQDGDAWGGMRAGDIIEWKRSSHPEFVPATDHETAWALARVSK